MRSLWSSTESHISSSIGTSLSLVKDLVILVASSDGANLKVWQLGSQSAILEMENYMGELAEP